MTNSMIQPDVRRTASSTSSTNVTPKKMSARSGSVFRSQMSSPPASR
jgi:hypothetical protein